MAVSVAATQTILPGDGAHDDETPTDHAAKSHRVGERLAETHIELPTLPIKELVDEAAALPGGLGGASPRCNQRCRWRPMSSWRKCLWTMSMNFHCGMSKMKGFRKFQDRHQDRNQG